MSKDWGKISCLCPMSPAPRPPPRPALRELPVSPETRPSCLFQDACQVDPWM